MVVWWGKRPWGWDDKQPFIRIFYIRAPFLFSEDFQEYDLKGQRVPGINVRWSYLVFQVKDGYDAVALIEQRFGIVANRVMIQAMVDAKQVRWADPAKAKE